MHSKSDDAMEHIAIAARAMTDAEPPADLEARIKRRLDAVTQDVAPRWWPRYLYGAAGIAVGIIAIATLVRSPEVPEFRSPEVPESRSPDVSTFRSPEVVAVQTPEPRDFGTSGPRGSGTSGPRDLGTSQADLAWMARRIPALERIEALTVNPMVFESIQPEPLSITPMTMAPLVTSPANADPDAGRR